MNVAYALVINQQPAMTDLGSNHHNLGQLNALSSHSEEDLLQTVYYRNQSIHLLSWELPAEKSERCVFE